MITETMLNDTTYDYQVSFESYNYCGKRLHVGKKSFALVLLPELIINKDGCVWV